jgi:hypothetical protein
MRKRIVEDRDEKLSKESPTANVQPKEVCHRLLPLKKRPVSAERQARFKLPLEGEVCASKQLRSSAFVEGAVTASVSSSKVHVDPRRLCP